MIPTTTSDLSKLISSTKRLGQMRAALTAAGEELTTGRKADIGGAARERLHHLTLETVRAQGRQETLTIQMSDASRVEGQLDFISTTIGDLAARALGATTDTLAIEAADIARDQLDGLLSVLGYTVDAEAVVAAAGSDPNSIGTYFSDPSGFVADFSTRAPHGLADVAQSDAAREALADLTIIAVGLGNSNSAVEPELTDTLLDLQGAFVDLRAELGAHQQRLEVETTRTAQALTRLGIERNGLDGVDPYEAATRLQAQQDGLEVALAITRRLSDLTLARYL